MTVLDRIRQIVAAVPNGASVTLPVAELRGWIEEDGEELTHDGQALVVDLTVEDIAQQFDRTPACVRGWCRAGRLPGAYRLNGREWRIPRAALAAYIEAEKSGQSNGRAAVLSGAVDLGAWRREEGA